VLREALGFFGNWPETGYGSEWFQWHEQEMAASETRQVTKMFFGTGRSNRTLCRFQIAQENVILIG
jgi:hypothetical protein